MADADTKENLSNDNTQQPQSKGNDALASSLAEVQEQLRNMNAQMEATQKALIDSKKPITPQKEINLYDPEQLLQAANEAMDRKYRAERAKDVTIYELSKEYPEIQTDSKIRQAVLEAQKGIPESFRDTAEGYEMAVLKAVSKAGLIAKSKRQTVDEDVSIEPRSGGRERSRGKTKVSEKTLAVAAMFGRDINDPKVLASLEEAANRDDMTKWR